eukprot:TRINITY_DN2620_c0_g1_i3.p1 TRINITY_DN2620_c0_g1~~TRINITY_DN2620_c0_g1_i3.p1  ORF type:complete len:259 (-),score=22.34 TRINITY_DN2620_c0_g1_i3:35-811(-)
MNLNIAILVVLFATTVSGAALITDIEVTKVSADSNKNIQLNDLPEGKKIQAPQLDTCSLCVQFLENTLAELIDAINEGTTSGCSDLCSAASSNPNVVMVCNLVCDYVGYEEFVQAIRNDIADPDPINICQQIDMCPTVNGGAVTIYQATVSPSEGPQGTTFTFQVFYTVTSPTGPGLFSADVIPTDAMPFGHANFSEGQPVGKYSVQFAIQTMPSEAEPFNPGKYLVQFAICAGDCTTDHQWSGVYASVAATFEIVTK